MIAKFHNRLKKVFPLSLWPLSAVLKPYTSYLRPFVIPLSFNLRPYTVNRVPINHGFTLLEVMIAMAICGILFLGIGSVIQQQIKSTGYLEKKAAADQLAWNLMETYRLEGKPLEPDYTEGIEVMGNHQLIWTRKISRLEDSDMLKSEFIIGEEDSPLAIQSWLWR